MGSLIAYSGIATKVKAMERWRIKDEQFLEMAALETVPDAVQLSARLPALTARYSDRWRTRICTGETSSSI